MEENKNNCLEVFVQENKYPVSDNVKKVLEDIVVVREDLIETWKKLCISEKVGVEDMYYNVISTIKKQYHDYRYYYGDILKIENKTDFNFYFYDKDKNSSIGYSFNDYEIKGVKIIMKQVLTKENIKIIDKKEDIVYKNIKDLRLFQKIESKFGKKFIKDKNLIHIVEPTLTWEYYLESFDIRKPITPEEGELLVAFFNEQKLRKTMEGNINSYNKIKTEVLNEKE